MRYTDAYVRYVLSGASRSHVLYYAVRGDGLAAAALAVLDALEGLGAGLRVIGQGWAS